MGYMCVSVWFVCGAGAVGDISFAGADIGAAEAPLARRRAPAAI